MRMNEGLLGEACNLSSRAGARIEKFSWISLSGVDAEGLSWCPRVRAGKYGIAWMWERKRCCDLAEKEAAIFRGCELAAADMLSYLDAATATRLEL